MNKAPTPNETYQLIYNELQQRGRAKSPEEQLFDDFLTTSARTGKNDPLTNFVDIGRRQSFNFSNERVHTLFDYLEAIRRSGGVASIAERQYSSRSQSSGLMFDFDLIVDNISTAIGQKHAYYVVAYIVQKLRTVLVFDHKVHTIHAFLTLKSAPVPSGESFKYGFHVLLPGLWLDAMSKKIIMQLLNEKALETYLHQIDGVISGGLDLNSASVPALLLGSKKPLSTSAYILKYAWSVEIDVACADEEIDPNIAPLFTLMQPAETDIYNLVAEMSLTQHTHKELVTISSCSLRHDLRPTSTDPVEPSPNTSLSTTALENPDFQFLYQCLDLLTEKYYTDYPLWRDVVFALANTSLSYKPLAVWFSQKCPQKWRAGGAETFEKLWSDSVTYKPEHCLTRRSLIRWAKECNPETFAQVCNQTYFTILMNYVYMYDGALEHYMVAKLLHTVLGARFVVDVENTSYCWYEFVVDNQSSKKGEIWKWRKEVEPDTLQRYLSEHLLSVFDETSTFIKQQTDPRSPLRRNFKQSTKKLFNNSFKHGVIQQAQYIFRLRGFAARLDTDPHLLGVGNGVLKLGAQCELIDKFHEYPISLYTETSFIPFDATNAWTCFLLQAFQDIIPEQDFREWLLYYIASSLGGGVKEGILLLWNGAGANGKTFIMRLVAKTLGHVYAKKLNIALLTSPREAADRPNSALMQLKGCRFGYVEETQKSEPLNSQRLKEIVNPGEISGRDLNRTQENFDVTANIMVGQNYDFIIDTTDHGTWRRIRHYRSKIIFCSTPSTEWEKKDDQRFVTEYINNIHCLEAMLSIMVHYYEKLHLKYGGLVKNVISPTLETESRTFRNGQDTINRFITENVIVSPGWKTYALAEIGSLYKDWHQRNINQLKSFNPAEVIQQLENSILQPFIRRAANKTPTLHNCRILSSETDELQPHERFLCLN